MYWHPPQELSRTELLIAKRTRKRRKIFVFLREHRHHIINDELQQKLLEVYNPPAKGSQPVAPGLLAMATLLQAYCNVSDQEAVELTMMDQRWQMVLDCLGCEKPPFSQGTLVNFRNRMIEHGLDKVLLDRSVEVAEGYGGFGPRQLKAVLDSSPLFGAARVEDTFNLIGHGLSKAIKVAAKEMGLREEDILKEAGLLLMGHSSLKAALDLDWGQPQAKAKALNQLLEELERWKGWMESQKDTFVGSEKLQKALEVIDEIVEQDTEPAPSGEGRVITKGTAKGRRVSIEDGEMAHGRKSKSKRFEGFKQHFLVAEDSKVIREVVVKPANKPENEVIPLFSEEMEKGPGLESVRIDLGYAGHEKIQQWEQEGVQVVVRPWSIQPKGGLFGKDKFPIDFEKETMECPAGKEVPIVLGKVVEFPASSCAICELRKLCTSAKEGRGRGVRVREDEEIQVARREAVKTTEGRGELRKRVVVEHRISHAVRQQGRKARYVGTRKNQFDGRRHAAVLNLQMAAKYDEESQELKKAA